ncbi:MAG: tetratricopeptide repeat protein [Myxococcota bacterium]
MECLGDQAIVDLIEGRASSDERARMEEHLDGCASCRAVVAAMARSKAKDATASEDPAEGLRLGRYLLGPRIGAGAMGSVYRAQDPELLREVAIKVVRSDLAEGEKVDELHARLLREARTLARLAHPNVVTVFDAGVWEGRVFIAMELVQGSTLGRWVSTQHPRWPKILQVFMAAGSGLAAAHAEGVVHRDFKPDNVLIGADERPRVMDFGLSRAARTARPRAPDEASPETTQAGALIGTPAYMAPEQLAGGVADARSDQYSFAAALWEALYGARPYAGSTAAAIAEAIQRGTPSEGPRSGIPRWLRRSLLRALSFDPARRYPSMSALLQELAGGQKRARRWRNLAVFLAIPALLAAGAAFAFWRVPCPSLEEGRALIYGDPLRDKLHRALTEHGPSYAEESWVTIDRMLGSAADRLLGLERASCLAKSAGAQIDAAETACLGAARAELLALIGSLADVQAVEIAQRAVANFRGASACTEGAGRGAALPADPAKRAQVAAIEAQLGNIYRLNLLGRYAEALEPARAALEDAAATGHRPTEAKAAFYLGETELRLDHYDAAKAAYRRAARAAAAGGFDYGVANAQIALVYWANQRGEVAAGEEAAKDAAAALERLGPAPELEASLATNLGTLAYQKGDLTGAEREMSRALAIDERVLGPDHPQLSEALEGLGGVYMDRFDFDAALAAHQRALEIRKKSLGLTHPLVAHSLDRLGGVLWGAGRLEEARSKMESAIALSERNGEAESTVMAEYRNNLALVCQELSDLPCALENIERSLAVTEAKLGPSSHAAAIGRMNHGLILRSLGRLVEAKREGEAALASLEALEGPDHPDIPMAIYYVAEVDRAAHRYPEALRGYRSGLEKEERATGPDHPDLAFFLTGIGETLTAQAHPEQAIAPLEQALRLRLEKPVKTAEREATVTALRRALRALGRDPTLASALLLRAERATTATRATAKNEVPTGR